MKKLELDVHKLNLVNDLRMFITRDDIFFKDLDKKEYDKINNQYKKFKTKLNETNPFKEMEFTLDFTPTPYSRPRMSTKQRKDGSDFKLVYNPRANTKREIKKVIKTILDDFGLKNLIEGEIIIHMDFYIEPPKSKTSSVFKNFLIYISDVLPITRPDIDNYAKLMYDCLNGLLFKDDSQIHTSISRKLYINPELGETPHIDIRVIYREQIIKLR